MKCRLHPPWFRASARRGRVTGLAAVAALGLTCGTREVSASPPVFSPAWFSSAAATHSSSLSSTASSAARTSSQTPATVQQSIADMTAAAVAVARTQSAQAQAISQAQAAAQSSAVPNGLSPGGLAVDPRVAGNAALWSGAALPTQTASAGRTTVTVQQTQSSALLNWQSFNVGTNTTLNFDQSAGGSAASGWVVLNRINDPRAQPSRILGSITAPGQVWVMNANGIIFGAGAQVNSYALIAASTTNIPASATGTTTQLGVDTQLLASGIYSAPGSTGYTPSFSAAGGAITVQAGAQLATSTPATGAGGYVLLMGSAVSNSGSIVTPAGQTILAAGQNFILRPGYGSSNPTSTTLGNEIAVQSGGIVTNSGLIQANTGDITLVGETITQAGTLLSTTSVNRRGSIHLLTDLSDTQASVTLAPGSLTLVGLDGSGATAADAQRAALIPGSSAYITHNGTSPLPALNDQYTAGGANVLADRQDQSRIEITSGGRVGFQPGSLTMATGGQLAVAAVGGVTVATRAVLDVAGALNVSLPASATTLAVSVQGYELRDAPSNRDTGVLTSETLTVDINQLVQPNTTSPNAAYYGYSYTAGGLLEVSGELGNVGHTIQEWSAPGGSITLAGTTAASAIAAQPNAILNVAGGSLSYQAGMVPTSWLLASTGQIYNVNSAPADLTYVSIYRGITVEHARWGITQTFQQPLIGPSEIYQAAYTVGRDAGSITLSAPTVAFQGQVDAGVVVGNGQVAARPSGTVDAYALAPTIVPLAGALNIGNVVTSAAPFATAVSIGTADPVGAPDTTVLSAALLDAAGLGGLSISSTASIAVTAPLTVANGGSITLAAPSVSLGAALTARGGTITLGNAYIGSGTPQFLESATGVSVALTAQSVLDVRGVFSNLALAPGDAANQAFINGGTVTIDSSQAVMLPAGSLIDASAGGVVLANGSTTRGGQGGSIAVTAYDPADISGAVLPAGTPFTIAGTLRGYGVSGGGTLALHVPQVLISDAAPSATAGQLVLAGNAFTAGFAKYDIDGYAGLQVASNTTVQVQAPVYQFTAASLAMPSLSDPAAALSVALPPLYTDNPATATVTQRAGASLVLRAAIGGVNAAGTGGALTIGLAASISVDPGQAVRLEAYDQITIAGTITAPGGSVTVLNDRVQARTSGNYLTYPIAGTGPAATGLGQSIWLTPTAALDVSSQAVTALDRFGQPFGLVPDGGSITLGGNAAASGSPVLAATDSFIVLAPGAVLSASGASAVISPSAGQSPVLGRATLQSVTFANSLIFSNGGTITLNSSSGLYLAGTLQAAAGGPGATGGTLALTLATPVYGSSGSPVPSQYVLPDILRVPREVTIAATATASPLFAGLTPGDAIPDTAIGQARLGADQVAAGGFDTVSITAGDSILFDGKVSLTAGLAINLTAGVYGSASAAGQASLTAPHVTLNGLATSTYGGAIYSQIISNAPQWAPSTQATTASLSVNAVIVDIAGEFEAGIRSSIALGAATQSGSATQTIDRAGFAGITITSSGDLRLLPGPAAVAGYAGISTSLLTPGNLTLDAAQLYPVTGASAALIAGFYRYGDAQGDGYQYAFTPTGTLTVGRSTGAVPDAPLSAGGALLLAAGTIEQGGIVRAPAGQIMLGVIGEAAGLILNTTPGLTGYIAGSTAYTAAVSLQPGSLTSVSTAGLSILYGGTSDGVTYLLGGTPVTALQPNIALAGQSVSLAAGAVLDLSGGGTLQGSGFIFGRGGSADVLTMPLLTQTAAGTLVAPSLSTNQVFAILPGAPIDVAGPAATASATSGSIPALGEQITIGAGVPGLPAATYLLLPGADALLPGAYRVELTSTATSALAQAAALGNGSYRIAATTSIAGTAFHAALPVVATLTAGSAVRSDAEYDEETYSQYVLAQAALFGSARSALPADAKTLSINFPGVVSAQSLSVPALSILGTVRMAPAAGGFGGTAIVTVDNTNATDTVLEITAPGQAAVAGIDVPAAALNALGAATLSVGASPQVSGSELAFFNVFGGGGGVSSYAVTLRSGALLAAPQVFLAAGAGGVTIEQGAAIDTLGAGPPPFDFSNGILYANNGAAVLAVSNGTLSFLPATSLGTNQASGPISIGGACAAPPCAGAASLLSGGTITVVTTGSLTMDASARYAAPDLSFAVPVVNFSAAANPTGLPAGLTLTQSILNALLAGDAAAGVPALQQLTLNASQAVNFFGSVDINTVNPSTGQSSLTQLVLNTPAIYGAGTASDRATLTTGTLYWNGVAATNASGTVMSATPAAVIQGGAGSGAGTLDIVANQIVLGYGPGTQPNDQVTLNRVIQGFSAVQLTASTAITANNKGNLSVTGDLALTTPLLTGAAGSVSAISATGQLTLQPTAAGPATGAGLGGLGAEIDLAAASISNATTIALASGQLTMRATGDITLAAGSRLDLAGRTVTILDQTTSSWGGNVVLQSANGNITQQDGASIDISAAADSAGSLSLTATGIAAGVVTLGGSILGSAPAGFTAAYFDIRAQAFGATAPNADFAALNASLNAGGVFGSRSFELLQGSLAIGNRVQAQAVTVSVDAGSLTVSGAIDASGPTPGSIQLSAHDGLTLAAGSLLDAHATALQTDSAGAVVAAENTASVQLATSAPGSTLSIAATAAIDTTSPDGIARGQLVLNVPRNGAADAGIAAASPVSLAGVANVVVNAFRTYTPGDAAGTVNGALLNQANADSTAFITAANANTALAARLAGLVTAAGVGAQLQPGVEIDSTAASAGDLKVVGDINLVGYRYGTGVTAGVVGSGVPGSLVLRAADDLTVQGSISDGFAPPPSGAPLVIAALLPYGAQSWSLKLVAGAQLAAADTGMLQAPALLAAATTTADPAPGSLVLSGAQPGTTGALANWSVIRTGTGALQLLAGGDFQELSPYGIYTAGAQSAPPAGMTQSQANAAFDLPRATAAPTKTTSGAATVLGSAGKADEAYVTGSNYTANYPDGGGNVTVAAQGNVTGDLLAPTTLVLPPTDGVGNWLWRQGSPQAGQDTAWWINFGTYVLPLSANGSTLSTTPMLTGFIGIGTLGGGNVTILAGGNAGVSAATTTIGGYTSSQALDVAVASTGRVVNGAADLTGGGNITIRVGGTFNGGSGASGHPIDNALTGTITDLRGHITVRAGSIGQVDLGYTGGNALDPRAVNPLIAQSADEQGGPTLVLGDATALLAARGDVVLGGVGDPTRLPEQNLPSLAALGSGTRAAADTWFSLWQPDTAIALDSAGGNVGPSTQSEAQAEGVANGNYGLYANQIATDSRFVYPPILTVVAASGGIYYGAYQASGTSDQPASIELAPSAQGQLVLLAAGAINANQYAAAISGAAPQAIDISGADPAQLPTPLSPAFRDLANGKIIGVNASVYTAANDGLPSLFAFAPDTATGTLHAGDTRAAIVAAGGDIVDLRLGEILTFTTSSGVTPQTWYIAGKATEVEAGGDLVAFGQTLGSTPSPASSAYTTTGSLLLNSNPTDVSILSAGRDIIYANTDIAGPGQLYVQAGRKVYQAAGGVLESLGPLSPNAQTRAGGAGITVIAGVGPSGPDWTDFAALYLNPANLAAPGVALGADGNTGKVAATYATELLAWLQSTNGYQGSAADALASFEALPAARQSSFLLQVYFAELRASGREFTNPASERFKSYARGREAIATLFPQLAGATATGDITLFGGSGIHTDFGGTISLLSPAGQVTLGVSSGPQPPATAGVLTQGQGDIDIYAKGDVALGQSRVFTTFGGSIVIWSAAGDINAGRGANSTDVYSPSLILYNADGDITLAPSVPATGAGIATLAPLAGIAAGDVDLIAPLGVIDAGEAGIRVSGNVNLAALTVVNAANVQVGGKSAGLPTIAAPNVGALASASAAAASGNQTDQQASAAASGAQRQTPSTITVEVTGYGGCPPGSDANGCASE